MQLFLQKLNSAIDARFAYHAQASANAKAEIVIIQHWWTHEQSKQQFQHVGHTAWAAVPPAPVAGAPLAAGWAPDPPDNDGDGVINFFDDYPNDATRAIDTDGDGMVDRVDADDDGDGITDEAELDSGTDPLKTDTDGDGVNDKSDAFPLNSAESADADGDGIGANTDANDNVPDSDDDFPLDPSETLDTDSDGMGNNADLDDDNDGLADAEETTHGTDPLVVDSDGDGLDDGAEVNNHGTNPLDADSDGDGLNDGREIEMGTDPANGDTDEDSVNDNDDDLPLDPGDTLDSDGDGVGDNRDVEPGNPRVAYKTKIEGDILLDDGKDARNVIVDFDDLRVIRLNPRKYELTGVFDRDLPHWNFFEEQDRQVIKRREQEKRQ